MSELTKEYLDKQLDKLATKNDIEGVKNDIEGVKNLVIEEVNKLAVMTAEGLEEIKSELNVKKEVENLNRRMFRIERALNIRN